MARSCSATFKEYWKRKGVKKAKMRVQYKRLYYQAASPAGYVYEANWQILEAEEFEHIDGIPSTLETMFKDVYRTQTFTLRLKNVNMEWLPTAYSPSRYAADDITGDGGYDGVLTKFRVQFAYVLEDGTTEYITNFTGYGIDPIFDSASGFVEFTVAGTVHLLEQADASDINTAFTNEATSPSAGDGATVDFYTTSTGVERVTGIRKSAAAQGIGTDVTIKGLENPSLGAKITFAAAPGSGDSIDATGEKCQANQTLETIVGLLCDVRGIDAGSRDIRDVIFPGGLSGTKTVDSQVDWENGTLIQNIETIVTAGKIGKKWLKVDNFDDNDYTSDPTWDVSPHGTYSIINHSYANGLMLKGFRISNTNGVDLGSSLATLNYYSSANGHAPPKTIEFRIFQSGSGIVDFVFLAMTSGVYSVRLTGPVKLYRDGVEILDTNIWPTGAPFIRITRTDENEFEVFVAGASGGTVQEDSGATVVNSWLTATVDAATGTSRIDLDDIYWSADHITPGEEATPSTADAVHASESFDLLAPPTAWGALDRTHTLRTGTITYKTAVSDNGSSWDAWIEIDTDTGIIQSALKRYLKIQTTIVPADAGSGYGSPTVDKLVANFQVLSIYLTLARHRGKKCWPMIQRYARLCNYECGADSDGILFFRPKTTESEAVATLTQEQGIEKITDYHLGYEAVRNVGQVTWGEDGEYFSEYGKDDAGEAEPSSETHHNKRVHHENFSDLLLANDVNIGESKARLIYEENYFEKKTFRIIGKLVPWAEAGDRLNTSFFRDPKDEDPKFGDPLSKPGEDMGGFGPPENVLARDMDVRILGEYPNFARGRAQYFVQEILS